MKRWLYQITIIIVSLFIIQGFSRSLIELWQQKQRLSKAKQELVELEKKEEELKKQLAYYQSDEYVEKIAREKLMLGKPGEEVILLPKADQPLAEMNTNEGQNKNIPLWKRVLKFIEDIL